MSVLDIVREGSSVDEITKKIGIMGDTFPRWFCFLDGCVVEECEVSGTPGHRDKKGFPRKNKLLQLASVVFFFT